MGEVEAKKSHEEGVKFYILTLYMHNLFYLYNF